MITSANQQSIFKSKIISSFSGEFDFMSNFSDHSFALDGVNWKTSEHAYQAAKCFDFTEHEEIRNAPTPGKAKRLGQKVTFIADWDIEKAEIMRDILVAKFLGNPDILEKLKATGDAVLIEGNVWHDNIWGDCSCNACENMLGNLLMWIREAY